MIPRTIKLEGSARKYKAVLDARVKQQEVSRKRREVLMSLASDCISGKQKKFGGRFAKPSRRNKIILSHIVACSYQIFQIIQEEIEVLDFIPPIFGIFDFPKIGSVEIGPRNKCPT